MEPIASSAKGDNAYYLGGCRYAEHNPPYCACLDKIRRVTAGEKTVAACCSTPIKDGTCPAVSMRTAEELAGHAMYYVPRAKLETDRNAIPAWAVPPAQSAVTGAANAKAINKHVNASPKFSADAVYGTYADAINAALATPAPAHATPPTSKPSPLPGESPIAYARRCAAIKENA